MKKLKESLLISDNAGQGRLKFSPSDHPPVATAKVGVLIANLGTPDATDYWSMRRYLSQFLSDRRVIDYSPWIWQPLLQLVILSKRPFSSGDAYKSIWNNEDDESPLLTILKKQTLKLQIKMFEIFGESVVVDFCMRYGNPSTESKIKKLKSEGCERILFFPLYPQYAAPTSATANDQAFRTLMDMNWQPAIRTVPAYYENQYFISSLANSIKEAYDRENITPDHLVVSYHGVPERYLLAGDPYHCQCQKTTRLLASELGWEKKHFTTAFQSKFGPEKWVGPATVDYVAELVKTGIKNIAVVAPAFSADCVETLEEINIQGKESFTKSGGINFDLIPCLNDSGPHINLLESLVKSRLTVI